jgi:hypothetical protein
MDCVVRRETMCNEPSIPADTPAVDTMVPVSTTRRLMTRAFGFRARKKLESALMRRGLEAAEHACRGKDQRAGTDGENDLRLLGHAANRGDGRGILHLASRAVPAGHHEDIRMRTRASRNEARPANHFAPRSVVRSWRR